MSNTTALYVSNYVAAWRSSPFANSDNLPWSITKNAESLVRDAISTLGDGYVIKGDIAIHHTTTIEDGAVLKGPIIIGPNCLVAAAAYLRGGVYLQENCIIGPGAELKTSFMFAGSKIAHLNFVGDSIIGAGANIEAGAMVANYRNELDDKTILIQSGKTTINTGVDKFGALVGDGVKIGANAVIAPGAILPPNAKIRRLQLVDQYPPSLAPAYFQHNAT